MGYWVYSNNDSRCFLKNDVLEKARKLIKEKFPKEEWIQNSKSPEEELGFIFEETSIIKRIPETKERKTLDVIEVSYDNHHHRDEDFETVLKILAENDFLINGSELITDSEQNELYKYTFENGIVKLHEATIQWSEGKALLKKSFFIYFFQHFT